jgi:CRP-like cAMP-binding protein
MRLKKNAKVDLLADVPLFAGCSKTELSQIASITDELDLGEGATLIREGERGREFLVVIDGTVRVIQAGRTVNELGPGDWVGEIALIADVPRTATVVTTSPVRLLVVTDRAFQQLIRRTPSIAAKVLQSVGERLHHSYLAP